jgi:preprotein translocase subunit SecG
MTTFLILLMIVVCILMVLVVLVQRGRGGGLSGAFGSGGGSNSAFGTKTGDVFTTITVVFFVVFMLLAIGLAYRFKATSKPEPVTTGPAGAASEPAGGGLVNAPTTGPATSLPAMPAPETPTTVGAATTPAAAGLPAGPATRP